MNNLSVIFSTDDDCLSRLIRWRTGSDYSHVDISINDCKFMSSVPFAGVRSWDYIDYDCPFKLDFAINDWQVRQIMDFYAETVGARYDWCGALGLGINRDWQNPGSWFCSEWVAIALERAGMIYFDDDCVGVTPGELLGAMR